MDEMEEYAFYNEEGDPPLERQKLSDRPVNIIPVWITTESGCDPEQGEYSLYISNFIGSLNINAPGGVDDISLVIQAIQEMDFSKLPSEGNTQVILEESGEWEDVFWNKYYVIKRVCCIEA